MGGGLHRSNPTVEKARATWPHQKPEDAFIAHRLLLDNYIAPHPSLSFQSVTNCNCVQHSPLLCCVKDYVPHLLYKGFNCLP